MTSDDLDPAGLQPERMLDGLDPEDLDGHTIEELGDYLDANRQPRNPSIENSAGSRIALDALSRLRDQSWAMLEDEARADPNRDVAWMNNVLANISRESRAGRDIPVSSPNPATTLKITEGSLRGLVRAAGDGVGGALIGRVALDGDVAVPFEPISVDVTASVVYGRNLAAIAQQMRAKIIAELQAHTELNIAAVNVSIEDVHTDNVSTTKDHR